MHSSHRYEHQAQINALKDSDDQPMEAEARKVRELTKSNQQHVSRPADLSDSSLDAAMGTSMDSSTD